MASSNLFALLDSENEDLQHLAANVKPAPAPAKPAEAKPSAATATNAARAPAQGRGAASRGRGETRPQRVAEAGDANGDNAERPGRGRGNFGNRPAGRGGRFANAERPFRREFERHDGTGRGHELQKRGGGGKGNWGAEGEEASAEEAKAAEGITEANAAAAADTAPVEEEKTMSLEEYEAQLAAKKAALNKPVTEVKVDLDVFKGMKTYVRKDSAEVVPGVELSRRKADEKATADKDAADKAKKQVITLETNFKIEPADVPGAGRGGRGGRAGRTGGGDRPFSGRGGRTGGGDRPFSGRGDGGSRGRGPPAGRGSAGGHIPIDDANAFPSLN